MSKFPSARSSAAGDIELVRVFVNDGRGGNPVPLIVDALGMTSDAMHSVAAQYGLESAFVLPAASSDADWRFRFFVPEHEMEMCGHATVGALWAMRQGGMWHTDTAVIETLSGKVAAYWDEGASSVWISQPKVSIADIPVAKLRDIASVLEIPANAPGLKAINACTSRVKTLIRMPDIESLNALRPDFSRMRDLCESIGSTGLYPYALPAADSDLASFRVHARQFPKASGYPEDAATGIAAAALWGWLRQSGEMPNDAAGLCMVVQGETMGAPSSILVRARTGNHGVEEGCWLSGRACWGKADQPG